MILLTSCSSSQLLFMPLWYEMASHVLLSCMCSCAINRGVWNPMKMSDIGFLKTEPNRTDLKIQKPKTRFLRFGFQKNWLQRFGDGFSHCLIHNSSSNIIVSKEVLSSGHCTNVRVINRKWNFVSFSFALRLCNLKPLPPQPSRARACPGQEGRCTHTATCNCWWNDRRV